ncbi:MAG: T9SS type A sorting domain-containing protein, partial [Saprospiraceae bacterium]|nr:T9SS type A sorting domain-containing protein [Saprospiraceae bacterium]
SAKSLTISNEASITLDNSANLQIDGSTSTYALTLNGGFINMFGALQITNCQSGIGLLGQSSSVTNTGIISVDNHSGYGLTIVSGCIDCNVVTSSNMSFDNGSTFPAIFFGAGVTNGNIIINSGTINIGATAHVGIGIGLGPVSGYFINGGTINISNSGGAGISSGFIPGTFVNSSTGIVNFGAGLGGNWAGGFNLNLQNDGQININKAGTPVSVVVSGTGSFGGSEAFSTSNKVSPGSGSNAGCLLFNSGYSNSGTTNIKLGGTIQCSEYDELFGSTTFDVSGTLNVTLINGFVPTAGQSFTIINAATRTGFFTTTNYPSVPGIAWTTSYTGTSVIANAQAVLPVEMVDFSAKQLDNNEVLLEWQTASELDNSGFAIEKSPNGAHWEEIGFVEGQGNSQTINHYQFMDKSIHESSTNYYRLRQIDLDGQAEFSEVVVVYSPENQILTKPTLSPNPTNGHFKLIGKLPSDAQLTVYDNFGRVVMNCAANDAFHLDASKWESGIYTAVISHANEVSVCRLVKQD